MYNAIPLKPLYHSELVGEFGSRPLYKTLGYFSLIGLLRVHVLLGDYTLALKVMDNIELSPKVVIHFLLLSTSLLIKPNPRRSLRVSPHAMSRHITMSAFAISP